MNQTAIRDTDEPTYNCAGCGRFVTAAKGYLGHPREEGDYPLVYCGEKCCDKAESVHGFYDEDAA